MFDTAPASLRGWGGLRRYARRASAAVMALVPLASAAACQDATQITLTLRTNVPYDERAAVTIWAGATGTGDPLVLRKGVWTGDPADLGSLVVTPRSRTDEPLRLRVVMGIGRDPASCSAQEAAGCIVARRQLSFVPRTALRVPVVLHLQCSGVVCDDDSTCNALGRCVPAAVDVGACASNAGCVIPDDEPGSVGPRLDASGDGRNTDADAAVDATNDVTLADATEDATPPTDACAPGVPMAGFARGVAFCGTSAGQATFSICSSSVLCNTAASWQQCSATQYRAAFTSVAPPIVDAGIRSCIRDVAGAIAPTDQPCSSNCNITSAAPPIRLGWSCAGGVVTDSQDTDYIGLVSASVCSRTGVDDPATAAYWRPYVAVGSFYPIRHAACCRAN